MNADDESIQQDPQTYAIIGACMAVHNELRHGFLEAAYQEALEIEFARRGIPFVREMPLVIYFTGIPLRTRYDADFFCYDSIIVELKAVSGITDEHRAQVHNYLKASSFRLGLLVNFGKAKELQYERIVR